MSGPVKLKIVLQEDICPHDDMDENGNCPQCGLSTNNVSYQGEWGEIQYKKAAKSILPDLEKIRWNIDLPLEVRNKANDIFTIMNVGTHRSNRRKQLIFKCLLSAHRELGLECIPKLLAKDIGLKPGDITKALSSFSQVQTGYESPMKFKTCLDILPELCSKQFINPYNIPDVMKIGKLSTNSRCWYNSLLQIH